MIESTILNIAIAVFLEEVIKPEFIDRLRSINNLEQENLPLPDQVSEQSNDASTNFQTLEIPELLKAFHDYELGKRLVQKIQNYKVDEELFIKLAEIAKNLSQETNEGKPIVTSIILMTDSEEINYCEKYKDSIFHIFDDSNFLDNDTKILIREAFRTDGENKVLVVLLMTEQQKSYKTFSQMLNFITDEDLECINSYGNYDWKRIKYMIQDSGCAFILPGKSEVKLLAKGEQIAEFRKGKWRLNNFNEYEEKLVNLSQELSLDKDVLKDMFHKCLLASEHRQGLTLIVQREENILKKSHNDYQEISNLQNKKIMDFKHQEYLGHIRGDNAVVLDKEGYTRAIGVIFAPQASTEVVSIRGTGSRHFTAQKMTKEADTIAFVVSQDGPITVFHKGESVFRVPMEYQ